MRVLIQLDTTHAYGQEVSFSPHIFRLFPKTDRFLSVHFAQFVTNNGASIQYRRDLFDNEVASCFYPQPADQLRARLTLELQILERNAFDFLLASHALNFPFTYQPREARVLAPYLEITQPVHLPFWEPVPEPVPTISALMGLNLALHQNLRYERREEGAARTPEETLSLGSGACRDFTVLLAAVLRTHGLAARLASGYLCEFGSSEKRAEGALHAWTEVYLPGAGWVGLDPTNGIFCNHNHITAAVGLTPEDIAPMSGTYFSSTTVPATMESKLEMHLCEQ